MKLIIGTSPSKLALWQSHHIQAKLEAAWPDLVCDIRPYSSKETTQQLDTSLPNSDGKEIHTTQLEKALNNGEIDIAIHALKDLPITQNEGIILGAIIGREDVRDVLITQDPHLKLGSLSIGATVGISSLRRQVQLLEMRPDLQIRSIQGNVGTRVQKVLNGAYDATVLAYADIKRLELTEHIAQILPLDIMLPAPGQGAIGVQGRQSDSETGRLLEAIHQPEIEACTIAERAFSDALNEESTTPVGAYAQFNRWEIYLQGLVGLPHGSKIIRVEHTAADPLLVAKAVAEKAIAAGAHTLSKNA